MSRQLVPVWLQSAQLALTISALFWAGNFVVGRALRVVVHPVHLNFWRWSIALLILLILSASELRRHGAVVRRNLGLILLLGLTGVGGFHTLVYMALQSTPALNALLFLSLSPVMILVGSWLVLGEAMSGRVIAGVVLSLLGAVTLLARADLSVLINLGFRRGDIWMLIAVVLWSSYTLLLRRRPADLPPRSLLTVTTLAGLLWMTPFYVLTFHGASMPWHDGAMLAALAYVSVGASIIAFLFWNYGVAKLGPARAGHFLHLMPLFGAALSYLLLGEQVHPYHLIGGALIFGGIALANYSRRIYPH